jgi:pimeloyl-ACP methyl ester carboxylesterase
MDTIQPETGVFLSENSSGQHKIFYQSWGNSRNRPLICVHGLTGSSEDFKYIGEYLSRRGYYVAALDMPGRGRSDFLPNPADYSFSQYFKDLRLFMAHLDITEADWLGVSMGGLLGIHLAGEDRSPIKRMILSDVGPEVPAEALQFIAGYLTLSPVFSTIEDVIAAFKQSKGTPFYRGDMTEEQWRHYASSHVRLNESGLWVRGFDPRIAFNFMTQPLGKEDLWPFWERITQPVLTLRGELSVLLTEDILTRMQARKPGTPMDIIRIKNAGHVPSLYPEDQIRLIEDWLQKTLL